MEKCSENVKKMLLKPKKFKKCKIKVSFLNSLMYESNYILGKHSPICHPLKNIFCIKVRSLVIIFHKGQRNLT